MRFVSSQPTRSGAFPIGPSTRGHVTFVGAGPGAAELLTLKAARILQETDVILFDDLVSDDVLALARCEARLISVGKRAGRPRCTQCDIDAMMIGLARAGHHVTRLKSGDPSVFGRTGEEIAALEAAGIGYDVVPGITAGIALAAALGVSLTHRDHARSVRFVTGHSKAGGLPQDIDWRAIADPFATTIFYMAGRTAGAIAARLLENGLPPDMPVAVAAGIARPSQHVRLTCLSELHQAIRAMDVSEPILIGVGGAWRTARHASAAPSPVRIGARERADSERPEVRVATKPAKGSAAAKTQASKPGVGADRGDCFRSGTQPLLFEAARCAALASVGPLGRIEDVPLAAAAGRVLAKAVRAPRALPAFDQAAMDGYALRLDGRKNMPCLVPIGGSTNAGDSPAVLMAGTAHRVMTGAAMPSGADTVVVQERVNRRAGFLELGPDVLPDTHIRRAGEDVRQGMVALHPGCVLGWPQIALLAALGIARVPVAAPVRIAALTTGAELHDTGTALPPGGSYNSNGPMLAALLGGPAVAVRSVSVDDELRATATLLANLAQSADLILVTGGLAHGDKDCVSAAVERAGGQIDTITVAMKPGKRLALGTLGSAKVVGLPGNPQAAAFGALAFVRPMVARLAGAPPARPAMAALAFSHPGRPGRAELVPVRLQSAGDKLIARRTGPEGSHRLMPIADADAVAIVPGSLEPTAVGEVVEILPFGQPPGDGRRHGGDAP